MHQIVITYTPPANGGVPHVQADAKVPDKETCDMMMDAARQSLAKAWEKHELQVKLAQAGGRILLKESR